VSSRTRGTGHSSKISVCRTAKYERFSTPRPAVQGGVRQRDGASGGARYRAGSDDRLTQLPEQLARFTEYLDSVVAQVRVAGDLDAAGAEVEDAHREALAKVAEAERRTAAERARREAESQAAEADTQHADTDAAEDAITETGSAAPYFTC